MKYPYTAEWLALSRHIGDALCNDENDITLTSGTLSGNLLSWLDEKSGTVLLTAESAWLDWVVDLAPAQSSENYSSEVLHALSEWTFEPVAPLLSGDRFNAIWFSYDVTSISGLMITLRRNGKELDILVRAADWHHLHAAVQNWLSKTARAVADLPVSLVIGQSELTTVECRQLVPGMGIVLQQTPDLDAGELWLALGNHRARATLLPDGQLFLNTEFHRRMQSTPVLDGRERKMNDIPLTLSAEIGQVTMTLGELQQLKPGDVLNAMATLNERVQLKVNGYTVAWGELIQAENGWLVRVCQRPESMTATGPESDA